MQETKDPKSTESAGPGESIERKDPGSDATSSETLKDLEGREKEPETTNGGESGDSSVPSPDGAFDEGRGSGGIEDAGPM